jgi:hypothetical protein
MRLLVLHPYYAFDLAQGKAPILRGDECVDSQYLSACEETVRKQPGRILLMEELGFGRATLRRFSELGRNDVDLLPTWWNRPRPVGGWGRLWSVLNDEPLLLIGGQYNKVQQGTAASYGGCLRNLEQELKLRNVSYEVGPTYARCFGGAECRFDYTKSFSTG